VHFFLDHADDEVWKTIIAELECALEKLDPFGVSLELITLKYGLHDGVRRSDYKVAEWVHKTALEVRAIIAAATWQMVQDRVLHLTSLFLEKQREMNPVQTGLHPIGERAEDVRLFQGLQGLGIRYFEEVAFFRREFFVSNVKNFGKETRDRLGEILVSLGISYWGE
jgi:hypothetical protein